MLPALDVHYTDPAQSLTTAGEELDDLDHDLSVLDDLDHDLCLGPERVVASIYQRLRCCCCCCCCWYLRNRSFYPTRFWEKLLRNIYIYNTYICIYNVYVYICGKCLAVA